MTAEATNWVEKAQARETRWLELAAAKEQRADAAAAEAQVLREQADTHEGTAEQLRGEAAVIRRRAKRELAGDSFTTDLWLCGALADSAVQAYQRSGRRDCEHVVYACPEHLDRAREAIPAELAGYVYYQREGSERRNCGERFDYTRLAARNAVTS